MADSARERNERLAVDLVAGPRAAGRQTHQTGIDQHLEMLGDGGLGKIKAVDDILAAAGIHAGEMLEDLDACGMGECGKPLGQRCALAASMPRGNRFLPGVHRLSAIYDEENKGKRPPGEPIE